MKKDVCLMTLQGLLKRFGNSKIQVLSMCNLIEGKNDSTIVKEVVIAVQEESNEGV